MEERKPSDLGSEYAYEMKYDGTQAQIFHENGIKTIIYTKQGLNRTKDFPHIAQELHDRFKERGEKDIVVVGEICFFDENGRCVFPLKNEMKPSTKFVVFDVVRQGNYAERRVIIENLLSDMKNVIISKRYKDFQEGWKEVTDKDLEGLVAKPLNAHFQAELGIKMKNHTDKDVKLVAIEVNENDARTFVGDDFTRVVCYEQDDIKTIEYAFQQGKTIMITLETLTGTNRFPRYKKFEVK